MDILILKTNIKSNYDFTSVKEKLKRTYDLQECTIDLEDRDKVMRVIGNNINLDEIAGDVKNYGFVCEELVD
jgi:hypothetical protein